MLCLQALSARGSASLYSELGAWTPQVLTHFGTRCEFANNTYVRLSRNPCTRCLVSSVGGTFARHLASTSALRDCLVSSLDRLARCANNELLQYEESLCFRYRSYVSAFSIDIGNVSQERYHTRRQILGRSRHAETQVRHIMHTVTWSLYLSFEKQFESRRLNTSPTQSISPQCLPSSGVSHC